MWCPRINRRRRLGPGARNRRLCVARMLLRCNDMLDLEGPEALVLVAARRDTIVPLQSQDRIVVVRVDSAASAVSLARESTPAVVMLDVNLPDASGFDVCRQLRDDPTIDRSVPVLLLTSTKPTAEQRVAALR